MNNTDLKTPWLDLRSFADMVFENLMAEEQRQKYNASCLFRDLTKGHHFSIPDLPTPHPNY